MTVYFVFGLVFISRFYFIFLNSLLFFVCSLGFLYFLLLSDMKALRDFGAVLCDLA